MEYDLERFQDEPFAMDTNAAAATMTTTINEGEEGAIETEENSQDGVIKATDCLQTVSDDHDDDDDDDDTTASSTSVPPPPPPLEPAVAVSPLALQRPDLLSSATLAAAIVLDEEELLAEKRARFASSVPPVPSQLEPLPQSQAPPQKPQPPQNPQPPQPQPQSRQEEEQREKHAGSAADLTMFETKLRTKDGAVCTKAQATTEQRDTLQTTNDIETGRGSVKSVDSNTAQTMPPEFQTIIEPIEPGAVRVRGLSSGDINHLGDHSGFGNRSDDYDDESDMSMQVEDNTRERERAARSGLVSTQTSMVKAEAVTSEDAEARIREEILQSAVEAEIVQTVTGDVIDPSGTDKQASSSNNAKDKRRNRLLLVAVAVLVVVAVVVGSVVVGTTNKRNDSTNTPSAFPTTFPSFSPSGSPTGIFGSIYSRVAIYPDTRFPGPDSPQYRAIQWLYETDPNFSSYSDDRLVQRYAVVAMAYGTDALETLALEVLTTVGWFTDLHECDWFGIDCTENGTVTWFAVSGLPQINGIVTAEIGLLSNLGACTDTTKQKLIGRSHQYQEQQEQPLDMR